MNRAGGRRALAEALIVAKNEGSVLDNRRATGSAELNAAEGRDCRPIEEIAGVKNTVAIKHVGGAVQLVCAGFGNGVNDCAGSSAVLRGVIAGQNGKFLNTVHTEIDAGSATWCGI